MGLSDQSILFTLSARDIASGPIDALRQKLIDLGIVAEESGRVAADSLDKVAFAAEKARLASEQLARADREAAEAEDRAAAAAALLAHERDKLAEADARVAAAEAAMAAETNKSSKAYTDAESSKRNAIGDHEEALRRVTVAERLYHDESDKKDQSEANFIRAKEAAMEASDSYTKVARDADRAGHSIEGAGNDAENAGRKTDTAGLAFASMGKIGTSAMASVGSSLLAVSIGAGVAAAGVGIFGLAAAAGAAIAATALAVLPLGFMALAAVMLKGNEQVKSAFTDLGESVKNTVTQDIQPLIPAIVGVAKQASDAFKQINPDLIKIFQAIGPEISVVTTGILQMVENMMGGITVSIQRSMPVIQGLSQGMADLGTSLGSFFEILSRNSVQAGAELKLFLDILGTTIVQLGTFFGIMINQGGPALVAFGSLLGNLLDTLNRILPLMLTSVVPAFSAMVGAVNIIIQAIGNLLVAVAPVVSTFIVNLSGAIQGASNNFMALGTQLGMLIGPFGTLLSLGVIPLIQPLLQLINDIGRGLIPFMQQLASAIGPAVAALGNLAIGGLRAVWDNLTPLLKPLGDLVGVLGGALTGALGQLRQPLQDLIGALVTLVVKAITPLLPAIGDLAKNLLPPFAQSLGAVAEAASKIIGPLGDILGVIAKTLGSFVSFVASNKVLAQVIGDVATAYITYRLALAGFNIAYGIYIGLATTWTTIGPIVTAVTWAFGAAMQFLAANPVVILIALLAAAVAAIIYLGIKFGWWVEIAKTFSGWWTSQGHPAFEGMIQKFKDLGDPMNKSGVDLGRYKSMWQDVSDFFRGPGKQAFDVMKQNFINLGDPMNKSGLDLQHYKNIGQDVGSFFGTTFPHFFETAWHDISQWSLNTWHDAGGWYTNLKNDAINLATAAWHGASQAYQNLWHEGSQWGQNLWHDITAWFTNAKNDAINLATDTWHTVSQIWQNTWHEVSQWGQNLWHDIAAWFTNTKNDAINLATDTWHSVSQIWLNTWHEVSQWGLNLWHDVAQWFTNTRNDTINLSTDLWHSVSQIFQNTWHEVSQWGQNLWHDTSTWFMNMRNDAVNWANNMWGNVVGAFIGMKNQAIGVMRDLANFAFVDPINWVVGMVVDRGIDGILGMLDPILGTNWHVNVPLIPRFAGGGTVPGYAPGQDTVHALLSPGEGVLTPQTVRGMGGASTVDALNRTFGASGIGPAFGSDGTQMFSLGGIVSAIGGAIGAIVGDAKSLVMGGLGAAAQGILNTTVYPLVDHLPGSGWVPHDASQDLVHVIGQKLVGAISSKDAANMAAAAAAGGGSIPPGLAGTNAQIVQGVANTFGWGGGVMWADLVAVIMRESGFNNNAQNPTSSAYGIFQFLDSTWASYGVAKTSDPARQALAGLRYIASRYGNPAGALAHEQAYGWYDEGGYLGHGDQLVRNHTGRPEMVLPPRMTDMMEDMHERWGRGDDDWDRDDRWSRWARSGEWRRGHDDDDDRWRRHGWGHDRDDDDDRWRRWGHHGWGHDRDDDDDRWGRHANARHELGEFLGVGQRHKGPMQRAIGSTSMMTALGMGYGSGSPFGGVFLAENPYQSMGQQTGGNMDFWNESLEPVRWAQRKAIMSTQHAAAVSGYTGNTVHALQQNVGGAGGFAGSGAGGRAGFQPGDHDDWNGHGVYVDCRGATLMSDRDMDAFVDRIGRRMSTWTMPAAGVRIRR